MNRIYAILLMLWSVLSLSAQMADPVHFTTQLTKELQSLDNNGLPLGPSRSYNEDIQEYINWLDTDLKKYQP